MKSLRRYWISTIPPNSYIYRNIKICLLFSSLITLIALDVFTVLPSVPHWLRMRRLVQNVDKYAKMVPTSSIENHPEFLRFIENLKQMPLPPYLIFFDNSNLDVTFNHICNLEFFPNAVERLAVISFDPSAERALKQKHPQIPSVTVDFTPIRSILSEITENRKYVTYQLVLLLRARISAALAGSGVDFWAMQQDSIWTTNFGEMDVESSYPDSHLLFDTVGNDQIQEYEHMKGWICGSTFFVRASQLTKLFFEKVAHLMTRRISPDSSIMTYLCGNPHYKCTKLPKRIISSSNYFMGNRNMTPAMIQVDHDSQLSKMDLFRANDFNFISPDGTCNSSAVRHIDQAVRVALPEVQRNDAFVTATPWERLYYSIHEFIGMDPYYNRRFLRVHESLV